MRHRSTVTSCTHITEIISQNIKIDFRPMKITFYFQKIFQFSKVVSLNTSWLSVCAQIAMVRKSYSSFSHCLWNYQYWRGGPETSSEDMDRDFQVNKMWQWSSPTQQHVTDKSHFWDSRITIKQISFLRFKDHDQISVVTFWNRFKTKYSLAQFDLEFKCMDTVNATVKTTLTFQWIQCAVHTEWRKKQKKCSLSHSFSVNASLGFIIHIIHIIHMLLYNIFLSQLLANVNII